MTDTIDKLKQIHELLLDIGSHSMKPFTGEKWNNYRLELVNQALALLPSIMEEVKPVGGWQPIVTAPKGIPVLVYGGLAMQKTGGEWFSGMEEPLYQRQLQWQPTVWMPLPTPSSEGTKP